MALDLSPEHLQSIKQSINEARDQKVNNGGVVTISRERLDEIKKWIVKTLEEIITIIIKIIESHNEERLHNALVQELLNPSLQSSVTEVSQLRERLLERAVNEGLVEEVKKKGFIFTTGISVIAVDRKRIQQQLAADFDRMLAKAKEYILKTAQKNMDELVKTLNAEPGFNLPVLFQLGLVAQILEVIQREKFLAMREKEFQEQSKNESTKIEKTPEPVASEAPKAPEPENATEASSETPAVTETENKVAEAKVDETAEKPAGNQIIMDEFSNTLQEEIEREKKSIEELKNKISWSSLGQPQH
jgi:N-methylhydantoinase A/oxoprolinase/acetone carboxylase beta subunit